MIDRLCFPKTRMELISVRISPSLKSLPPFVSPNWFNLDETDCCLSESRLDPGVVQHILRVVVLQHLGSLPVSVLMSVSVLSLCWRTDCVTTRLIVV
jgi:hypothetical protein